VVDAFRKVGVGSRPATDSPTLAVVVLYDGAMEMAVWVGPVLGWGCRHKRRWEHEYGTPTSMGPVEAMMTAGLAGVRPGKITLDPFCGGGALLAAAACLGADSLCGGDVNGAHLQVVPRSTASPSQLIPPPPLD
jgi:tRNA G10  N-methylase Trm11